jgi:hypothetical protein
MLNDDDEEFIKFRERKDTIMTNIQEIGKIKFVDDQIK